MLKSKAKTMKSPTSYLPSPFPIHCSEKVLNSVLPPLCNWKLSSHLANFLLLGMFLRHVFQPPHKNSSNLELRERELVLQECQPSSWSNSCMVAEQLQMWALQYRPQHSDGKASELQFQSGEFRHNCAMGSFPDATFWCQNHDLIYKMVALMNLYNLIFIITATLK